MIPLMARHCSVAACSSRSCFGLLSTKNAPLPPIRYSPQHLVQDRLVQRRFLHVHEHVSFSLMHRHDVPAPSFGVARTREEALQAAKTLQDKNGECNFVVKAQVLAGGRGKGTFKNGFQGGVRLVDTPESVQEVAGKMLGQLLVTKQTGQSGLPCNAVGVFQQVEKIQKECYFALALDRNRAAPVVMASPMGGMDVEQLSRDHPDKLFVVPLDIHHEMPDDLVAYLAQKLLPGIKEITEATMADAGRCFKNLYSMFLHYDMTLLEINPVVVDGAGRVVCVDCKSNFDEDAAFRQKEIFAHRDLSQEDPTEIDAKRNRLSYIGLDGNLGCVVNGAGLAMAVMDLVHLCGGNPANFLDLGGGVTPQQMREAIRIVISNPRVKAILVYIFGGINHCDLVAEGLVQAIKEFHLRIPVVVRLQGTKSDEAHLLMQESGLKLHSAHGFLETVQLAVGLADGKTAAAPAATSA